MTQLMIEKTSKLLTQSVVSLILIFLIIIITLVTISSAFPSLTGQPLYDHNSREIRILADNNLTASVYGDDRNQERVQLIQFYNSWCGHCIAFAPTFKQLAKECHQWSQLMTISVVDCAQEANTKLCRDFDISIYPTLKLFWFSPKPEDKGFDLSPEERSNDGFQKAIIKYITDNWSKGVPRLWPDLMPVSALSKALFIKSLPIEKGIPIVLIVENEKSFLGREIILDMSSYQSSVTVLRMLDSSTALIDEILPGILSHHKLPFLMSIDNKDYTFKLVSMNVFKESQIREMFIKVIKNEFLKDYDGMGVRNEHDFQQIAPIRLPEDSSVSKVANSIESPIGPQTIHMSDLNNALRYSLFQEIPLKKRLNSTQINALKNYLSVLELHFPFQTEKMLGFIKYLNEWLSKKRSGVEVDIEDMTTTMKIYEDYYHFPEMKSWKGCAGSDNKYRGYPCSVWTLFHTLTVAEHKNTVKLQKWSTLHSVLYAMRDYIKNFFGCSYCAQHFALMAKDLESELTYPNSSVLWLWKAHNKVNTRLKGDASEDPKHPKQTFPLRSQCPECYESAGGLESNSFNEKNVLEFLLRHYSSDNILKDTTEVNVNEVNDESNTEKSIELKLNAFTSGKSSQVVKNSSIKSKWNYSLLNNMDYSLILFLYFSSAAIILSICLYLKLRKRKRGQKYSSLKSSLNYA